MTSLRLGLSKDKFGAEGFPVSGTRLVVEAAVTEWATGTTEMATDSSAMFVDTPYAVSFERTATYFKPGLFFTLMVSHFAFKFYVRLCGYLHHKFHTSKSIKVEQHDRFECLRVLNSFYESTNINMLEILGIK